MSDFKEWIEKVAVGEGLFATEKDALYFMAKYKESMGIETIDVLVTLKNKFKPECLPLTIEDIDSAREECRADLKTKGLI